MTSCAQGLPINVRPGITELFVWKVAWPFAAIGQISSKRQEDNSQQRGTVIAVEKAEKDQFDD